jgi:RNA polymerase sigma-70 factor (ECF subfamily)
MATLPAVLASQREAAAEVLGDLRQSPVCGIDLLQDPGSMSKQRLALCEQSLAGQTAPARALATLRAHLWRASLATWGPPPEATRGPGPSDASLLGALIARDPRAIDAIYERHSGALLGWALRYLPTLDAEEAVLDTFLVLVKKPETIDATRPLRAFLYTVLRGKAIDRLRAARRQPQTEPWTDEPEDAARDAARWRRLDLADLARAAATLDPIDQELLCLLMDGRSSPEIAAILGISAEAVRQRKRTLQQRLQAALQTGAA